MSNFAHLIRTSIGSCLTHSCAGRLRPMPPRPRPVTGLSVEHARVCVTGYGHNRPDPFPGLGDFVGWVGGVSRLGNGDLLLVHSAGDWHVSFATPIVLQRLTLTCGRAGGARVRIPLLPRARTRHDFSKIALTSQRIWLLPWRRAELVQLFDMSSWHLNAE